MRLAIFMLASLAGGATNFSTATVWAQAPVASGTITTIAGNGSVGFSGDGGPAVDAALAGAAGVVVDRNGAVVFSDYSNNRIRRVDPVTGFISTIAGNGGLWPGFFDPMGDGGPATDAPIDFVVMLGIDRSRNILYLENSIGQVRLRQVDLGTGIIDHFAGAGGGIFNPFPPGNYGDGGLASDAYFDSPFGIGVAANSDVYITDYLQSSLRRVDGTTGIINRVAGVESSPGVPLYVPGGGDGGPASAASLGFPTAITVDAAGNVYFFDQSFSFVNDPFLVRRIDAATGIITTVAGGGTMTPGNGLATDMELRMGIGAGGIAVDGQTLYVATQHQVFTVDLASGQMAHYAGSLTGAQTADGVPAVDAKLTDILGIALAPGGGLLVSAQAYDEPRLRYIAPASVNLSGDASHAEFHLPWVSALAGDLVIVDNPNLTVVDTGALTSVGGNVIVSGSDSATTIDLGSIMDVGGSVTITDSGSATTIDLGSLMDVGGSVTITSSESATTIDLGSIMDVGGNVIITDSGSATTIDLGSIENVGGSITVTDNGSATVVVGPLIDVGGDLIIDTSGTGTFDVGDAVVAGDTNLTTDGYNQVAAMTAAGQTALAMINGPATMELVAPDGAFPLDDHVAFSVQQLAADPVESWGETAITTLSAYQFNFAIATLGQAATLNFEIELAALDPDAQAALGELLDANAPLTVAVLGDAPDAQLQLFDVCAAGVSPVVDDCVAVQWLDETGAMLDPAGGVAPAVLRFEALVGHFSTYSIVATSSSTYSPGDIDRDGDVDRSDAALFAQFFGKATDSVWTTGDFDADGATTLDDLAMLQANFGSGGFIVSAAEQTPVPEPAGYTLAVLGAATVMAMGSRARRRRLRRCF